MVLQHLILNHLKDFKKILMIKFLDHNIMLLMALMKKEIILHQNIKVVLVVHLEDVLEIL